MAIDLETTGLDPRRDRIVSLAAVELVGGEPASTLVTLVHPGQPIPPAFTLAHGIDDTMAAGAPDEVTAMRRLDAVCAGQVVVGHRVHFDLAVLARCGAAPALWLQGAC